MQNCLIRRQQPRVRARDCLNMCDMTHSHVWHDSFTCVTWLIHMCDMTQSAPTCCKTALLADDKQDWGLEIASTMCLNFSAPPSSPPPSDFAGGVSPSRQNPTYRPIREPHSHRRLFFWKKIIQAGFPRRIHPYMWHDNKESPLRPNSTYCSIREPHSHRRFFFGKNKNRVMSHVNESYATLIRVIQFVSTTPTAGFF